MSGITVITPTGGRLEAFALLTRWMERQTYQGPVQWLVVDDCDPATRVPGDWFAPACCTVIRPEPRWTPGENTQARNLLAAFGAIQHDLVVIAEDDDYLAPGYLQLMSDRLEQCSLAGESNARYYHVGARQFRIMHNLRHSSLGQCGMRAEMLPVLRMVCQAGQKFIDIELFRRAVNYGKLFPASNSHLSMKGLPGRPGIGMGHQAQPRGWTQDANLDMLRRWIGDDAEFYRGFGAREFAA